MKKIRIVLDTNVWLSGLFWSGKASRIIEYAEDNKIKILVSEKILQEIMEVLQRDSKFHTFLKEKEQKIKDVIQTIISISELISSTTKVNVVKEDHDDDIILETALDGNAQYILTYDNHLLKLGKFGKIKIIQ